MFLQLSDKRLEDPVFSQNIGKSNKRSKSLKNELFNFYNWKQVNVKHLRHSTRSLRHLLASDQKKQKQKKKKKKKKKNNNKKKKKNTKKKQQQQKKKKTTKKKKKKKKKKQQHKKKKNKNKQQHMDPHKFHAYSINKDLRSNLKNITDGQAKTNMAPLLQSGWCVGVLRPFDTF